MIIYSWTRPDGEKCYVGKTKGTLAKRRGEHLSDARRGSDLYFHKALRKYEGTWAVLQECDTPEQLAAYERFYIAVTGSFVDWGKGYNLTTGDEGGELSEETRKKMSDARRGKKFSEEHCKSIGDAQRGVRLKPLFCVTPDCGETRESEFYGHSRSECKECKKRGLREAYAKRKKLAD